MRISQDIFKVAEILHTWDIDLKQQIPKKNTNNPKGNRRLGGSLRRLEVSGLNIKI